MGLFYIVLNIGLYLLIFMVNGFNIISVLYCLMSSALVRVSVIDVRTFEIPNRFIIFILILGFVKIALDLENWKEYVIGFFAVSTVLFVFLLASNGKAIGGGDVKLMAVCGMILGCRLIWVALFVGCIVGVVIHLIRMKVFDTGRILAMGPYLSIGVMVSVLWGDYFLSHF